MQARVGPPLTERESCFSIYHTILLRHFSVVNCSLIINKGICNAIANFVKFELSKNCPVERRLSYI